jgi:hypothetical protein
MGQFIEYVVRWASAPFGKWEVTLHVLDVVKTMQLCPEHRVLRQQSHTALQLSKAAHQGSNVGDPHHPSAQVSCLPSRISLHTTTQCDRLGQQLRKSASSALAMTRPMIGKHGHEPTCLHDKLAEKSCDQCWDGCRGQRAIAVGV